MKNSKDRPKKRCGCLKIVLILFLLIGVVRVALWLYAWSAVREFRAKGWPLTAEEYAAWYRAVPEEQNAGPLYMKAFGILSWQTPNDPIAVDKPQDVVEILLKAADLPECRFPGTKHDLQVFWNSARNNPVEGASTALHTEAIRSVTDGDSARAVDAVRAIFAMGRALSREPSLYAQEKRFYLTGSALDALILLCSQCGPPEDALVKLDAELSSQQENDVLARAYQALGVSVLTDFSDRHEMGNEITQVIGRYPAIGVIGVVTPFWPWEEILYSMSSWLGLLDIDKASSLRWVLRMENISRLPMGERAAAIASLDKDFAKWSGGLHSERVFEYWRGYLNSEEAYQGQLVIARAAIAIERYRQKNGVLPKQLADLVPAFVAAEPVNPLNEAPLTYSVSEGPGKGYTLGFWRDPTASGNQNIRPSALDRDSYTVGEVIAGSR